MSSPPVVLINEAMASRFWPKQDAVGKRVKIGSFSDDAPWLTVVGVFKNVRRGSLEADHNPWMMRPYTQAGWPVMSVVTKTAVSPLTLAGAVKRAVAMVEPNQPVLGISTMEQVVGSSVSFRRFVMYLLSGFALLALALAALGIAGVVGYSVVQRTPEIGVRLALGAQPRDVLRLIIGHSLAWTLMGVAAGVMAAVGLLRLLGTLLYGVTASDPLVLAVAASTLIAVAIAASYLPARRATRIDAIAALRGD